MCFLNNVQAKTSKKWRGDEGELPRPKTSTTFLPPGRIFPPFIVLRNQFLFSFPAGLAGRIPPGSMPAGLRQPFFAANSAGNDPVIY